VSDRFMYIPCEPAKGPDLVRPIYEFVGTKSNGAARCRYRCPHCGGTGPRYQPIARHMGLVMNVKASCKVLLQQDRQRREDGKENKT
jgi:hypothetical protein